MQEIIASISRIIAKDNRPPRLIPARSRENSGILELTEAIGADGTVTKLDGQGRSTQPVSEPPPATAAERSELGPSDLDVGPPASTDDPRHNLLSAAASEAAVAAFGQFGAGTDEQPAEPASSGGGRSLEEIVREAVRPLLRAWLKDHFPVIVEQLVREEIQRLVSEAEQR